VRLLITGAYGTLGPALIKNAVAAGHQVTCFELPTRGNRQKARRLGQQVKSLWGDITDPEAVEMAVVGQGAVVHLAGLLPPATEQAPELAERVNVEGTGHIVRAIRESGADAHLIYPSSVVVYGPGAPGGSPRRVGDPVSATDNYAGHKIAAEQIISASPIRWTIFRVGVSVDPGTSSGDPAILRSMFDVAADNRMEIAHPADLALAFTNALANEAVMRRILNLGGGESCRIRHRDLFDAVFGGLGLSPLPDAAFGSAPYYTDWLDSEESQSILNYQQHSFDDFTRECREKSTRLRLLLAPVRPLVRVFLLRYSASWRRRGQAV
jgi:nucleoside-diphosphate-sugar epimerase